jgi:hypothetical protein
VRTQSIDVNRVFHALSDATRRHMIERLSEGPVSVSGLAKPLVKFDRLGDLLDEESLPDVDP